MSWTPSRKSSKAVPPRGLPSFPDEAGIEQIVHDFMGGTIQGKAQGYRMPELRASAFPYCPVLMALGTPFNEEKYESDFYFNTGHAIHDLLQKWGGYADVESVELLGDWKCTGCGATRSMCVLPGKCNACGYYKQPGTYRWKYVEATIKWKGISGHVDALLQVYIHGRPYVVVGDFKTTLFRQGGSPAERAKFPYANNVMQIKLYSTLLWEVFKLDVIGWALIYVNRSAPIRGPRDYHVCAAAWDENQHDRWMKLLRWADRVNVPAKKVLEARVAGQPYDVDALWDVVAGRPCKSEASWKSWMAPMFKYDGTPGQPGRCPHLDACTSCGTMSDELLDYFVDVIEEADNPT